MRIWLVSLGTSLALTLLFELGFALAAGRRGRALLYVTLANFLTNPAVVLCAGAWRLYRLPLYAVAVAALEAAAVLTEGLVYRKSGLFSRPFRFSLAANALSFFLGLLLNYIA